MRDEYVSRFGLGNGELLCRAVGDCLVAVGDVVEIGIDELRLLLNDESLRSDCADSGRFRLAASSRRDTEFGPVMVVDRALPVLLLLPPPPPIRLPVLLLRLRFDAGPDGLVR